MTKTEQILAISKDLGLTHIGSNVSVLPVLEEIYTKKQPGDIVILDNAHAGLAHLLFLYGNSGKVAALIREHGIHCDRKAGCDASGGSLGHGIGIGIGYALADRKRTVYVVVSDGSMMEGSNWEALRIANDLQLANLEIHCNFNGYTALAAVDWTALFTKMVNYAPYLAIFPYHTDNGEGFSGVGGHYKKP